MAKMFYSLDEAAVRLGMSEDEVQQLASSGQLQEFRDRDRLMFKVEQVDLMAGGEDEVGIPLADSGEINAISLASDSGSGMNIESPKEQTGISIFDPEETEEADPAAQTQITESSSDFMLETAGSGSGLLDLTREGDDTSLGADLLDDIYAGDDEGGETVGASETLADDGDSGLFESPETESDVSPGVAGAPAMAMVAAEPYDGAGSGLAGGLALGLVATFLFTITMIVTVMTSGPGSPVVDLVGDGLWMWVGIFGGATLVLAVIGMLICRKG